MLRSSCTFILVLCSRFNVPHESPTTFMLGRVLLVLRLPATCVWAPFVLDCAWKVASASCPFGKRMMRHSYCHPPSIRCLVHISPRKLDTVTAPSCSAQSEIFFCQPPLPSPRFHPSLSVFCIFVSYARRFTLPGSAMKLRSSSRHNRRIEKKVRGLQ